MADSFNEICLEGDIEKLKAIYHKRPSPTMRADALYWACYANQVKVIDFFMEKNFDFTTFNSDGKSIISAPAYTTYGNSLKTLKKLMDYGLDIDTIDENGQTPLMFAVMRGNLDCITFLVNHGADLDYVDRNKIDLITLANGFENRDKVVPLLELLKIEKEKNQLEKHVNKETSNANKLKI
jgi:ankyrin repeat protein